MPRARRFAKPPPEGWELIEPTLDEFDQKMREGTFWVFVVPFLRWMSFSRMEYLTAYVLKMLSLIY
jgi:hypothetical protein